MSGYTTSYRWSGVTRANVKGLLRHDARDVERQNGTEVAHSNSDIDPRFTAMNETLVNDRSGNMVPMRKVQDALDFLDFRLAQTQNKRVLKDGTEVNVALRSDAAAVVEFVLELDPKFTRDPSITDDEYDAMTKAEYEALAPDVVSMSPEKIAEVKRLLRVMRDEVIREMGIENCVFITEHWDESHPHIQMGLIPVTDDNQVSMKKKLAAPTKALSQARYVQLHDSMRTTLIAAGYDATMDRVSAGKRHLPLAEFKKQKDHERDVLEGLRAVQQDTEANRVTAAKLRDAAAAWEEARAELDEREVKLTSGENELKTQLAAARDEIKTGRDEIKMDRAQLEERAVDLDKREAELENELADLPSVRADARAEEQEKVREETAADRAAAARERRDAEVTNQAAERSLNDVDEIADALNEYIPTTSPGRTLFDSLRDRVKKQKVSNRIAQADLVNPAETARQPRQTPAQKYGLGD